MNTWKPALALTAVLAVSAPAISAERDALPTVGGSSTTMTLGGKGTPEQAATEDTELARGYRGGYYGGHYGGYGYGGYRGGYYSGYRGGYYGGYGHYYRPAYYGGYYRPAYYYTPRVYYSNYYSYPVYPSYYGGYGAGFGFSIGISGDAASLNAPAVNLGTDMTRPAPEQTQTQPMLPPTVPGGTFRYDGGPANPVPLPKADPQPVVPSGTSATDLPVSLKPKTTSSPYKYKAYGEK